MTKPRAKPPDQVFLEILERGVRDVLKADASTAAERIAAINAGAKLLMIRHKIAETDESQFFRT
jgi:hypothetical protein